MSPNALAADVAQVRPLLLNSLPWSPFDFIKGISRAGDRAVQFDALLRRLDEADDLRFTHPISPDADVAVLAERLPWDSAFFGYNVARLHGVFPLTGYRHDADYTPALRALMEMAKRRGIKYLFGVVDARDLPTFRALSALGFMLLETRVFVYLPLRTWEYRHRSRSRLATPADVESLVAMSRTVENPYDRFNADPFIGPGEAHRLIAEWIRASLVDGFADGTIIPDSPNPGALITFKTHRDKTDAWGLSIGQMILAVAAPRMDNGFLATVAAVQQHLKERGFHHLVYCTQLTNRTTLRVGRHFGYEHGKGEYVFRILL